MTIMTYDAMSLVTWSADLVVLAALGRPEEDLDVARKYLTDAVHDAIHAQNAILFGTDDFHGRQVVGGTMWGMKDLYQLHFGESCLRPNKDCLPIEDDEDAWLTRRGFYFLLSNLCDEAARIARDPTPHLTWQNSRFQTLQRFGLEELRYGAEQR